MRAILVAAALFAAAPAFAQPVRLADRSALMFNLGGIFTSAPSALDGVGVGGRMFLDEGMALRGAAGINLASTKAEQSVEGFSEDREDSTSAVAIEGGVEVVLARAKAAYLYTGGLLQVGYQSSDPEGDDNDSSGISLTAAGLLGANYFVTEGLSLGAEYRLGLSYASVEQDQGERAKAEQTSSVIGVGAVGFHLGFWF